MIVVAPHNIQDHYVRKALGLILSFIIQMVATEKVTYVCIKEKEYYDIH